jgi:hypothetical protein
MIAETLEKMARDAALAISNGDVSKIAPKLHFSNFTNYYLPPD